MWGYVEPNGWYQLDDEANLHGEWLEIAISIHFKVVGVLGMVIRNEQWWIWCSESKITNKTPNQIYTSEK